MGVRVSQSKTFVFIYLFMEFDYRPRKKRILCRSIYSYVRRMICALLVHNLYTTSRHIGVEPTY
jgi:hypothetical protein